MKRLIRLTVFLVIVCSLSACSMLQSMTARNSDSSSENTEGVLSDSICYSPYESSAFIGMDFTNVETLFQETGFENINLAPVFDINKNSNIADGSVESVIINGLTEYTPSTMFEKDVDVIISYHSIPRITLPISPAEAKATHYMDVGKMLFDAGFTDIETDEVYDLSIGDNSKTIISINGQEIDNQTELPFDSEISVIGHFPVSEYTTTINIDFESNLIFSKYNVVVTLADSELGTLLHGENGSYSVKLPAGSYDLVFSKEKDSKVAGSVTLNVNSNATVTFHISCNRKAVEVETKDFVRSIPDKSIQVPFSSYHYLRKDYQSMVDELKALGFTRVKAKATTDSYWVPDKVNTVVDIVIQGKAELEHDAIIDRSAEIIIYYHVADFMFAQDSVSVTEKDSFELPYSLTSGDTVDSINFEIDNSSVLQRNEDGSYTALMPGTATVTASSGGHVYSKCKVEVAEIVVPIDKLVFPYSETTVSVGSTFTLDLMQ